MAGRIAKAGFGYHLTAYLAVNIVLLWINFDTSPGYIWAKWPIVGWGIGLAFHGLSIVFSSSRINKAFAYHLAAYIIINAFLIFINLNASPGYLWFKFPLAAWTVIVIFHLWHTLTRK